jgi:hypothetical protein
MSVTIHFKDTSTNKITSLEYEMGAVIPELGDYIVPVQRRQDCTCI